MIRTKIEAGWSVRAIYERYPDKLGTMSYRQLTRYVAREITGSAAASPPAFPSPPTPPSRPVLTPPQLPAPGPEPHARHEPAKPGRSFKHDPLEGPDDRRKLLGE